MGPYIPYFMKLHTYIRNFLFISCGLFNPLALELDIYSLAHDLCKM